jgi:type IV pilus assembly protein PilA
MLLEKHSSQAFTLIELMVIIVLIGLIAGFAIPDYTKALSRAKERDALSNLDSIRDAVKLYMSHQDNDAVPPDLGNVSAINTTLNLNVVEQQGNSYSCTATNVYTCMATNAEGWQLAFQLDTNFGKVFCNTAGCPTIP